MVTLDYILNKYNLKINKEFFIEVPNIGRDDLAKLYAELNFTKGAEVGVERGYYSEVLLKANPNLHLSCIDPWSMGAYEPGISGVDTEQEKFDSYYQQTKNRLASFGDRVNIIRKPSLLGAQDFEDNSLDFVYIDANHDFVNVTNDIDTWKKKVRVGGILAGHDYAYFSYKKFNHVKRVVEAYARCYRMRPYFVAGAFTYDEGMTRDKYRSWFWVKE